jgi:hypothetical protein
MQMSILIDQAWRQEEAPDWPSQAEMDEWTSEMSEYEWEAEQDQMNDVCFRPLPAYLRPRQGDHHKGKAS